MPLISDDDPSAATITDWIGGILREARVARGINQTELSKRCGLAQHYLSYVEHGTRTPSIVALERICTALDISVADVIWRAEALKQRSLFVSKADTRRSSKI